jgi:hypothetical protein
MATRKRVIPRTTGAGDLAPVVKDYLQNRSMRERSEYQEGRLKKELMGVLEVSGEQVDPNKQTLELDVPLPYTQYKAGQAIPKKVVGIERRKRTTTSLNADKALGFLAGHKNRELVKTCTTRIVVVDEDAILAANYAGTITDKELAGLYEESSTYAFYLTEE